MYNNPYITNYSNPMNQQSIIERIDNQIQQLQGMKEQMKTNSMNQQNHQPAINQTIQFAPNGNGGIRFVKSIDEVTKESVFVDTPFFSQDMTVLWIKKISGEIKAYELNEIVEKDEKDLQIEFLSAKINELEGMIKNEQLVTNVNEQQNATDTTSIDKPIGKSIEKSESTSIQRVSTSKKKQ